MVFCPSYRLIEEISGQFEDLCSQKNEEIEILCQRAGMHETEREDFLAQFESAHPKGLVGFCVMGGIFGEGIDLRKHRLIVAVIVMSLKQISAPTTLGML